jgi:glucan 1,3-beta-glucosidase
MTVLRGVNLGGWLVAERWMTPELFRGFHARDEYGLQADKEGLTQDRLLKHRREFITRKDINDIKQAGFDMVRVPVGHWLWQKTDGYLQDPQIVSELLGWCQEAGVGVVLSLHGAPGSQNGWDHSGRVGAVNWATGANIRSTLDTIDRIVTLYGHHEALIGLGVLNEPHLGIELDMLADYYVAATRIIKEKAASGVQTILSDGFRPYQMVEALHQRGLNSYILDVHLYQMFDEADKQLSFDEHISKVEAEWSELLAWLGSHTKVMVGEWSAMLAAETFAGLSDRTRRGMTEHYYEVQRNAFSKAAWGWAYWTYKTGGPSVWNWSAHDGLRVH